MRLFNRKPRQPKIDSAELYRLHQIEAIARKMVELLDDGKVDYDLLRELKKYL